MKTPAVFVSSHAALADGGGGVQICTREYIEVIRAAGFDLTPIAYAPDRRPLTRLRRRLRPRPYSNLLPPSLLDEVVAVHRRIRSRYIFLNLVDVAPLASALRAVIAPEETTIVLLSHGLESVDYLHSVRINGTPSNGAENTLGQQLLTESTQRQFIDCVVCLAPFEVEIERWLGTRRVGWLPRIVPDQQLPWKPDPRRLGCVSTVDHPPNVEGLTLFLQAFEKIAPADVRFRLIGGPAKSGQALAARFSRVDYLGRLDDAALLAEAATWSCFVHPLFCYARGCSTKLAVALGWRLPVATTSAGMRGYSWTDGSVSKAEEPYALAELAVRLLDPEVGRLAREEVCLAARSAPQLAEIATELRSILLSAPANRRPGLI